MVDVIGATWIIFIIGGKRGRSGEICFVSPVVFFKLNES